VRVVGFSTKSFGLNELSYSLSCFYFVIRRMGVKRSLFALSFLDDGPKGICFLDML
jgi:hypothetical protein